MLCRILTEEHLLDNVGGEGIKDLIDARLSVNVQIDRLGKVKAEDTHNGLGVNDISAGYQVEVNLIFGQVIYEGFYFINGI